MILFYFKLFVYENYNFSKQNLILHIMRKTLQYLLYEKETFFILGIQ